MVLASTRGRPAIAGPAAAAATPLLHAAEVNSDMLQLQLLPATTFVTLNPASEKDY